MIITDKGIIIDDNKHRSITGGVITVGHDMIEQVVRLTNSVMYQANSEKAVQCLLNSSAKDKICYPAIYYGESTISRGARAITENIGYGNKNEIENMNDRQKLLSLLINRAVIGYGHCIKYASLDDNKLNFSSKQVIFITFEGNEVAMTANTFYVERRDIMSCIALAELSDALWRQGWFIIRIIVSKSGTEVAYVKANWNRRETSKEAIETIKKYTSYR